MEYSITDIPRISELNVTKKAMRQEEAMVAEGRVDVHAAVATRVRNTKIACDQKGEGVGSQMAQWNEKLAKETIHEHRETEHVDVLRKHQKRDINDGDGLRDV